ncbi:NlpC/P60 family protein [Microbispora tritici]|uniref:NlpC/P60 family protein n=2 Tax=Microbispora TaxID=2005 RepID=A0ABY3LX44_9ACTN|nr:NlpC/P60 family protein [Microbispora fusca]TYB58451.1 NlpC/P60 family protein [Microbispora tritici]
MPLSANPTTLLRAACVTLGSAALTLSLTGFGALPAGAVTGTVTAPPPDSTAIPPEPPVTAFTPYAGGAATASTAEASVNTKLTKAAVQQEKAELAIKVAKKQIGDPYVWGATGPRSFDCSGLVQFAWRKAGVKIPRTTWSMLNAVKKKVSLARLKPGDLIFTSGGGHVGMYIGNKKVINAPHSGAVVRVDRLKGYWRSNFVTAVRPGV